MRYIVEFHDTDYQMTYGHGPRGKGMWAFFFDRKCQGEVFWSSHCTYSQAKREVLEYVKSKVTGSPKSYDLVMIYVGT